jgi:hypothetical protein
MYRGILPFLLSAAFLGGLSLDTSMVDPSEAQYMGQMHHFCLLDEMLVPRAREYAASIHRIAEREGVLGN